ncbi:MAG: RNA-guided pseudouridylation complex pseudouridine synthase subunit Cbf5 [Nanoarchaeota archaeon]|nr:RNA-guided pseudouridylation complex pseudouridine synthase subunit Cbf5 [Thermodesulfovibrionia bacterium]MCK5283112.1 RNA-guided pseudouridylation complex pseudouridine synthase subunit Cbf5 [Nanoarchaeota archaeon]
MTENKLPFEEIKKDIIIKKESITDPNLGDNPEKRKVEELIQLGIVNIDKPKGPTSHQVSDYAQRILNIKKAGHSGTLDPGVTGVLAIALGRATRIVQTLLPAGKEYVCIMHIHKEIEERKIKKVFKAFTGKITQLPPIKSAVKRQERERNIYYMEILEIEGKDVLFKVGCQAGTYIRKLCSDMGKKLGTGAHMAELRRTKAGCFDESTLCTLQDLADAYSYWEEDKNEKFIRKVIQPIENAVTHLPKIWVHDSAIESLCHGRDLAVPGISKLYNDINPGDLAAVLSLKNELIAIGEALMTSITMCDKNKGIAVRVNKVFMKEGKY